MHPHSRSTLPVRSPLKMLVISLSLLLTLGLVQPAQALPRPYCTIEQVPYFGHSPELSGNGRYLLFDTTFDMGPGSPGNSLETFLYDREDDDGIYVSSPPGQDPIYGDDSYTSPPSISQNGRYAAFVSQKPGLVENDPRDWPEVYLADRQTRAVEMISVSSDEQPGDQASWVPDVSADGRYVAFQSYATNLVEGDSNGFYDIFLRDREEGTTELISVASDGSQGGQTWDYGYSTLGVSADGRYVAFPYHDLKDESGVVRSGVFLRDREDERTYWLGEGADPDITPDGRYIVFNTMENLAPGDQNGGWDVVLYDHQEETFELVALSTEGNQTWGGDYITPPSISEDGRYITFATAATQLVTGDNNNSLDVFLRDRQESTTQMITVNERGQQANANSTNPHLSADGRTITFTSSASNLVDDGIERSNIYVCAPTPQSLVLDNFNYFPILSR